MAPKYLPQPHISISYIMLDSTRDSINSLQIPIVTCLSSVWHRWRQAPNTHVPAPALFPAISFSSRYSYSLNTYILWRHHLDYLTIHLICHLTLLWSDVFLRISIIPLLATLIFTPLKPECPNSSYCQMHLMLSNSHLQIAEQGPCHSHSPLHTSLPIIICIYKVRKRGP